MEELFDRIEQHRLLDWGVILQGVKGIPGVTGYLPPVHIERYATDQLQTISPSDPSLGAISSLALESDLPVVELRKTLEEVCESKGIDLGRSRSIWRLVALEEILASLDPDPVYGLIRLAEFWSVWGWPSDAPASMQLAGENPSREEYHSERNFRKAVQDHKSWLEAQLRAMR